MASGIRETSNNHFEIYYEHPWAGVASDADPADIAPSQLVTMDGVLIKNGVLRTEKFDSYNGISFSLTPNGKYVDAVAGVGFVFFLTGLPSGDGLFLLSGNKAYRYALGLHEFQLDQTLPVMPQSLSCYQVINNVVYIFDYAAGSMYVYTPLISYVVGDTFVAGTSCCVVDGYLITANTNQPSDAPAVKANRYNWSSPYGYTTWNPATDRTSGFGTIADAQDSISRCFSMWNVGFLLRTQGLTQLTPTGIGTQPFDATSIYSSEYGIGCTYPDSFSQYGNIAIWANDNNIYAFGGGGAPQAITGSAKAAIFADINDNSGTIFNTQISACISSNSVNSHTPELYYNLCIVLISANGTVGEAIIWSYNINNHQWTRQSVDLVANANAVGLTPVILSGCKIFNSYFIDKKGVIPFLLTQGESVTTVFSTLMALYVNNSGVSTDLPYASFSTNLLFRQEEIKLYRQPNIRNVLVKAAGFGTLHIKVGNQFFTDIVVNNFSPTAYLSSGMFTGENPQLQITSDDFDGYIVKAMVPGTFADGDI